MLNPPRAAVGTRRKCSVAQSPFELDPRALLGAVLRLVASFHWLDNVYHIWEYDEIFRKISSLFACTKHLYFFIILNLEHYQGKMESKNIDRDAVLNSLVLNNSTTDGQPRKRKRLDNLSTEERALRRWAHLKNLCTN